MTSSDETNAAIIARLFRAPGAPMGSEWLEKVPMGLTDASMHRIVLTSGTLSAPKSKDMYGSIRSKTQMKGVVGTPYWHPAKADTLALVQQEIKRLNPPVTDTQKRLEQLRTDKIGGLLLVTTMVGPTGPGKPFLTLLAAPSVATFNETTGDVGVTLTDIWDESVLAGFHPDLVQTDVHCPLIGAQEGFSRSDGLNGSVVSLLQDAGSIFLPAGELTCATVTKNAIVYSRTIFFPEVCNMPLGMRWPLDIGFQDFLSSIQAAMGTHGTLFQQALQALEPMLSQWFNLIDDDTASFIILGTPFSPLYDAHFPAFDTGNWPATVVDREGFSPLQDMVNGHAWRLWCDRVFTTGSKLNRAHLATYLDLGASVITTDTYLGLAIPGRFCPNFAHHFLVVNGWPTDSPETKFLGEFQHLSIISYQARQYDPVSIDLYETKDKVQPLTTREERTSALHRIKTPKYSYTKVATPTKDGPEPAYNLNKAQMPPTSMISIPSTVKGYSPSPLGSNRRAPRMATGSAQRRLEEDMDAILKPPAPLPPMSMNPISMSTRFNPVTATVMTAEGREMASDQFLNACRLLAHHSTRRTLKVGADQVHPASLIYVREPCGLYRREILSHLSKYSANSGFMPPFLSFMEAVLRPAQVHVSGVYDPKFFSGSFLHAFLSVESWMVSDHISPANVPPATFHVYTMISCLQKFAGSQLLIPSNGLTQLEAKQIGILTYYLFAMMDLEDSTFSDRKFEASILGQRLKAWSRLPDSATIHGLWNQSPLQVTYQWFASLQSLLNTIQTWSKRLRYHPERGFYHARDAEGTRYLLLDSKLPSNIPGREDSLLDSLGHYDQLFEQRWFRSSFMDSIWTAQLPPGHTTVPIASVRQRQPQMTQPDGDDGPLNKRAKLSGRKVRNPDFINYSPIMAVTVPVPANSTLLNTLFDRFSQPTQFPRLPSSTGTLLTICLNSAFSAPHNCCMTKSCGDRKTRNHRLHIDLSREPWKSHPESYWAPLVTFLQNDVISPHIRPTPGLQKLTPSANWQ
jgi:hypothetical protein